MKIELKEETVNRILSLAENFDDANEDCYESAAEEILLLSKEIAPQVKQ